MNRVLSYIIEIKDRASNRLQAFLEQLRNLARGGGGAGSALSSLGGMIGKLGGLLVVAQLAAQGLGMAVRGIAAAIKEAAAYEKDVYRLARAMGSLAEAKKAMAGLSKSDAAIDFGRSEVVGASVKLQNVGAGSLVNVQAMDVLAAVAKKADVDLGRVAEGVKDIWAALASGDGRAFKSSVNSMADMGAITPVVAVELLRLRDAGASAGEVFVPLYEHLENTKKKLDELGRDAERAKAEIKALKEQISKDIAGNFGFKSLSEMWDALYKKMLQGIRWLTEKPHRISFFIPGLSHGAFAGELQTQIEKRGNKEPAPTDVKSEAAAALNGQSVTKKAESPSAIEEEINESIKSPFKPYTGGDRAQQQAEERLAKKRAERDEIAERRRFDRLSPGEQVADITRRQRGLSAGWERKTDEQRMDAVVQFQRLQTQKENIAERESQKLDRAQEQNNKRAGDRRFDQLTDDEKGKWITAQMDLGKKALAAERDPLEREKIKGRLLDLAERGDRVEAARKQKAESGQRERESLAEAGRSARESLAEMGLSKSVGDIGISERFDWMGAVAGGKSPDEEIAANTQRMKELLEQIAKSEGIT